MQTIYFEMNIPEVASDVLETCPEVTSLHVGDCVIMDSRITGPTCFSQEISPPCRPRAVQDYAHCENQASGTGRLAIGGGWGDGYLAHESEVFRVPGDLTDDQAVLAEPPVWPCGPCCARNLSRGNTSWSSVVGSLL